MSARVARYFVEGDRVTRRASTGIGIVLSITEGSQAIIKWRDTIEALDFDEIAHVSPLRVNRFETVIEETGHIIVRHGFPVGATIEELEARTGESSRVRIVKVDVQDGEAVYLTTRGTLRVANERRWIQVLPPSPSECSCFEPDCFICDSVANNGHMP